MGSLVGCGLALKSPLPLFHLGSGLFKNFLFLWTLDLTLIYLLVLFFSSNCTIVFFLAQLAPFHCCYAYKGALIITWQWILCCLKISSANAINPNLFNLASSGFFPGQWSKAIIFFAKISQGLSLGYLWMFFSFETHWASPSFSTLASALPSFLLLLVWLIKFYLKHSPTFIIQSLKFLIPLTRGIVIPVRATPHFWYQLLF